jgi:serine/threonine-protein kinase
MQRYGMMLADGGNIALTMSADDMFDTKWADVGLEPGSLAALRASDFDVIIEGDPVVTGATECQHTVVED